MSGGKPSSKRKGVEKYEDASVNEICSFSWFF